MTPLIAENERRRRSAIDGCSTESLGNRHRRRPRKLVERVFGWLTLVGAGNKLRYPGLARYKLWF